MSTDRFARLPMWILDSDLSDRAVRLFAVLVSMIDYKDPGAPVFPKRTTLARRLHASVSSVDRAVDELRLRGAVETCRRWKADKSPTSNKYVLRLSPPSERTSP